MKLFILGLCLFCSLLVQAQTPEDFARLPAVSSPQISPNGEQVAYVITYEDSPVIVTKHLYKADEKPGVIPLKDIHLSWFKWVNDDRLIVGARMAVKRSYVGLISLTRMFSINKDGSELLFFDMEPNKWGYFLQHPRMIHSLPNDPEHVLLVLDTVEEKWVTPKIHKVNVYTGKKTLVEANRGDFFDFIADHDGNIRVGTKAREKGKVASIYYRDGEKSAWKLLQREKSNSDKLMFPVRFDYENNNILLFTSAELEDDNYDQDDHDLYRYDLQQNKIIGPYQSAPRESARAALQKAFPGRRVDLISWVNDVTLGRAFYKVYSDVNPPQYFLFDLQKKQAAYFGSAYPQLDEAVLHPMAEVNYKARDGLNIPAYLTLPVNAKKDKPKLPLVVYPHGGPWARDFWGFDNYVQMFANEGYAVLQPQFRGSTGFGYDHEAAGYQQWGLGIQDDITDGVHWLIEQGIADPARICIVGASFGGYAAAMGLAQTPDLYKCGISINGVMDLKLHYDGLGYYLFAGSFRELLNPRKDIKDVSPYHLRKTIKAPLLLIAGEKDTVVDPKHSRNMYKQLKKQGNVVDYVELPKGEHWRTIESNEKIIMQNMQRFLRQYLAVPAQTVAAP
jgi:Dipeptidyl aminopeptidases/acylaminoacyl-peptidases